MNRLAVLKAAWFAAHAMGERTSRRVIQQYTQKISGRKFSTDEVHEFIKTWQYQADDGQYRMFSELGPVQVPQNDQPRSSGRAQNGDFRSSSGPVQVQFRSARARGTIENNVNQKDSLSVNRQGEGPSEPAPAAKRTRIVPTPPAPVTFGEDEPRVETMLATIAGANASNSLAAGKVLRLRAEMRAMLDEVGPERWRYGMDQANDRSMSWPYAKAVIRKHVEPPKPKLAPWKAAEEEYQDKLERAAQREYAALGLVYQNGTNGKSHG